jgi:hypothetical protein
MPHISIHGDVEIVPVSRESFTQVMNSHLENKDKYERLPSPPANHFCHNCPIDVHTIRYVLVMIADLRDGALAAALHTPMDQNVAALVRFEMVNTLDLVMAAICGQFDPESGERMKENYE